MAYHRVCRVPLALQELLSTSVTPEFIPEFEWFVLLNLVFLCFYF
jgi:hypothetical protein